MQFSDATLAAGLTHTHWSLPTSDTEPIQHMTGGAAAGDFDNDGWVDLFFTRLGAPDVLYRNVNGVFQDVSATAGLTQSLDTNGAAWADIDNDGDLDLYVTTLQDTSFRNHLYINDGQGAFTEQAVARGAALTSSQFINGFSSTFGDYDDDGYLDLFTTEWNSGSGAGATRLLRNQGAANPGHFVDVTNTAGVDVSIASPGSQSFAFAPSIVDVDRDGYSDLVIAADFGSSQLFWNNGDGTFTDGTIAAGVGSDENGMGSALGDYDGDGDLDWFVSSIYEEGGACEGLPVCGWGDTGNRLYQNNGDRTFTDVTDAAGVRDGAWGWGSAFFDFDNDGDLDLTHTNGVEFPGNQPYQGPFVNDQTRLWENDGGVFSDVATQSGVTDADSGKGLLTLDYDRDGDLDLLVVNNAGPPILYDNQDGNQNDWIRIEVVGTASNADGLGAQVTVTPDLAAPNEALYHEVNTGSHYLGQSDTTAHFGLGSQSGLVDLIVIQWPATGAVRLIHNASPNSLLTVSEPIVGDFNGDGVVNAADFVAGRDTLEDFLLSDNFPTWVANYGTSILSASAARLSVPEPGAFALSLLAVLSRRLCCSRKIY